MIPYLRVPIPLACRPGKIPFPVAPCNEVNTSAEPIPLKGSSMQRTLAAIPALINNYFKIKCLLLI